MGKFRLDLLGGFRARVGSGTSLLALPTRKTQALLAYLGATAGRSHSREKLTALLWGETPEGHARQSFRQALTALRRALAIVTPPAVVVDGDAITLDPAAVDVDVVVFERLCAEGAPEGLERIGALYRGELLEGFILEEGSFQEWLIAERERLHELAIEGLAKLLAHQIRSPDVEPAIATAMHILALDPLQESVHRALMRVFVKQERRSAALRQYQICVDALQREFGTEPEAETRRLYREIVESRPGTPRRSRGAGAAARESGVILVGREHELARLRDRLERASRGEGQVVLITGEAGVGKSRLVEELTRGAEQHSGRCLYGRSYETDRVLPFGAWVDALRAADILAEPSVLRGLEPAERGELGRLFPELGEPMPPVPTTPENYVRLAEIMADLVGRAASDGPLLFVLEDLHWADTMSVRLLAVVGRRLKHRPVLVVGTARDEELSDAGELSRAIQEARDTQGFSRVALTPLSKDSTVALVSALARGRVAQPTLGQLGAHAWATSEGNPFVIVETVRAFQSYGQAPRMEAPALPRSVGDLVRDHLRRLGSRARQLGEIAAVIGEEFGFSLLQQAAGLSADEAGEGLEELVRRRVLHAVGERFAFTHDWIREVTYEGLLSPVRDALHAAVGRALEALSTDVLDDVCDRLAYHYSHGRVFDAAVTHLTRFAEKAARGYALDDAVGALREALTSAAHLSAEQGDRRQVEIAFRIADYLFIMGRMPETLDLLRQQEARIERLRDPALSGVYYFWLGHTHGFLGEVQSVALDARRALDEASRVDDRRTLGRAHYLLGLERYWSGRPRESVEHCHCAIAFLKDGDEHWWLGQSMWVLGVNLYHLGELAAARTALERLREVGQEIGNLRLEATAEWSLGFVHAYAGEYEAAIAACRRSFELAPDPMHKAWALAALGLVHCEQGDAGRAIPVLEQSLQQFGEFGGFRHHRAYFGAVLAEARLLGGRLDDARDTATQALRLAREIGYVVASGWALRCLGKAARAAGALGEAERHLCEALDAFASVDAHLHAARTERLLADVRHQLADQPPA